MVGNVYNKSLLVVLKRSDIVCEISVVDFDGDVVGAGKCLDLDVVAPCAAFGHGVEVTLERLLDLLLRRHLLIVGGRVGADVLALRIPADATAGVHADEGLELGGVVAHVVNGALADFRVRGLVAVQLVRQGIEQTVAWVSGSAQLLGAGCTQVAGQ